MAEHRDVRIAFICAAVAAFAYTLAPLGSTSAWDYYGRLGEAFLQGRWWLTENPPWLNELLSCGTGRWCVAYPPLPGALTVPLQPFVATAAAQVLVSQIFGGASAGLLYLGLRAYGAPARTSVAGVVVSALGSTLFFTAADGRAWFAAHGVAVFFGSAAFWVAAMGRWPVLLGALIGLAALARLPFAAATPGLALLLAYRGARPAWPVLARVVAGGVPFGLLYLGYNLLRWGSLNDLGYGRLSEGDVFFEHGIFSLQYIPRHITAIFLEPPDVVSGPLPFRPRYIGMSLLLTTPAFVWCFLALRRLRIDPGVRALALAAGLALVPAVTHATVGFQQFGYRFSLDAQPFLVALAVIGAALGRDGWHRPSRLFLGAVALSVVINVYAVIVIMHLGYWQ
ncbi:MAG: hypothetical protein FJ034_05970 [Chloroflexi bacterium]|nr:hypothetical protein [Chloroflexota bacterium]